MNFRKEVHNIGTKSNMMQGFISQNLQKQNLSCGTACAALVTSMST